MTEVQIQMTGVCLFVCVIGPGFDSTSPAIVRSRASQETGIDGRLAQKTELGPHLWGQGLCIYNLCRCLQQSNLVQAASSWKLITKFIKQLNTSKSGQTDFFKRNPFSNKGDKHKVGDSTFTADIIHTQCCIQMIHKL